MVDTQNLPPLLAGTLVLVEAGGGHASSKVACDSIVSIGSAGGMASLTVEDIAFGGWHGSFRNLCELAVILKY